MIEENQVYEMEAIEFLSQIDDGIVDMILCDLPYGHTACKWDKNLPLDELWNQYKRILKDNGVVVLTAKQPFTTDLINSNREWFRQEIIWEKTCPTNVYNAEKMFMSYHENILVFYNKLPTFNPQMVSGRPYKKVQRLHWKKGVYGKIGCKIDGYEAINEGERYPKSIVKVSNGNHNSLHPTQKPISLFRWLIRTYTQEGDLVVDNCVGSGTTAVACKQANRRYVCCDINPDYIKITKERLNQKTVSEFYPMERIIEIKRESSTDSPNSESKIRNFA